MDTIANMHVTVHVQDAMPFMVCATPDVNGAGGEFIARKVYNVHSFINRICRKKKSIKTLS